ncbi:uncharacterized protein TNCV_4627151 [Trichonephila clavipes]|nr:uncharacterized protein TNCV_4627151 [Trichonephila clavipes]
MDQINAFSEHISTTVVPVTLPEKPDALEYASRQGQVRDCIIYQEPNTKQVFSCFAKTIGTKKTLVDNFKRAIMEAKHVNEFRPDDVLWEKISKGLLRNPDRPLKNTDKKMVYIYNNMFFVKKKTLHLASERLRCRANPNLFRRSFEPYDQMLYHRMVLEPHTAYPILAGTRYILLTVQKILLGLDIIPETILPQLMENGFNLGILENETVRSKSLQATSSYPGSCTCRDKQTIFGRTARAFLQTEQSVYHTHHQTTCGSCVDCQTFHCLGHPSTHPPVQIPVFQPPVQISPVLTTPPVQIPDPPRPPELTTPLVQIPDPPVQIPVFQSPVQLFLPDPPPVQILLPDPPPVVETLEPTLMDDSSMDQIMASVFGDFSPQGIPPAHIQEPQVLDTVPSLFDESNDLISFLDNFETGLIFLYKKYQAWTQEYVKNGFGNKFIGPVLTSHHYCVWKSGSVAGSSHVLRARHYPYTIIFEPNFGVHIPRSFGKTVIVFTSHLDLTWDKGVELRFFQVGHPPSHQVWDAYQPQTTDAYILNFADCTQVADVYVKWLTWLDDWEMHRDDNVPWRMVGLQP